MFLLDLNLEMFSQHLRGGVGYQGEGDGASLREDVLSIWLW